MHSADLKAMSSNCYSELAPNVSQSCNNNNKNLIVIKL